MNYSKRLAGVIGPVLLAVGIGVFVNRDLLPGMLEHVAADYAFLLLTGLLLLAAGLAIVRTHNIWSSDWRVLITVFGWLGIVGGLVRIFFPGRLMQSARSVIADSGVVPLLTGLIVLAGGFLTYQSFVSKD